MAEAERTEKITLNLGLVDLGRIDLPCRKGSTRIEPTFFAPQHAPSSPFMQMRCSKRSIARRSSWASRATPVSSLKTFGAAGGHLQIRVLGLATIADDVPPELALATIESVEVLGAFRASTAVKAALRDRIR